MNLPCSVGLTGLLLFPKEAWSLESPLQPGEVWLVGIVCLSFLLSVLLLREIALQCLPVLGLNSGVRREMA